MLFFFFFFSAFDFLMLFDSRDRKDTNTFDSETLASLYFSVDTESRERKLPFRIVVSIVEIIDILCAAFIFFHQKNRIIFRRDICRYVPFF